jgi:hypothetical protein
MNILAVLIVGSPLLAMAGLPVVVHHPAPLLFNDPLLKVADNDDFAARKDAYLQKTRNEMAEWQKKIDAAGERAEADTKAHLNRTWAATQEHWRTLQAESAESWDKTKNAYERSTAELRAQWHQLHPEDKD